MSNDSQINFTSAKGEDAVKGPTLSILTWSMVAAGLSVPFLPRLIVPMINPVRYYYDTLEAVFLRNPAWGFGLCLSSALPFVVLSLFARFHLGRGSLSPLAFYRRAAGVIVAFLASFGLGLTLHAPQTTAGVNLGIVFFPLYGVIMMPAGYGVGWMIAAFVKRA